MDFLLLLPRGVRVVLEVDGKQHYAGGDTASPRLYSEMVSEDRGLRPAWTMRRICGASASRVSDVRITTFMFRGAD